MYCTESLVSFLRKHDVIKIGPEQKGNVLCIVQPTLSSTLGVYDIRPPIARYKFPATFTLFSVVRLGYAQAQLSSLYLLSIFGAFHVTKNTRLSTPAQLQCLRSGAWEPGNEAR